jgi:hypothetical protein
MNAKAYEIRVEVDDSETVVTELVDEVEVQIPVYPGNEAVKTTTFRTWLVPYRSRVLDFLRDQYIKSEKSNRETRRMVWGAHLHEIWQPGRGPLSRGQRFQVHRKISTGDFSETPGTLHLIGLDCLRTFRYIPREFEIRLIDRLAPGEITTASLAIAADEAFSAEPAGDRAEVNDANYDLMLGKVEQFYIEYPSCHPREAWATPDSSGMSHNEHWRLYRSRVQKQLRRFARRQGWDDQVVQGILFRAQLDAATLRPRANALVLRALRTYRDPTEGEARFFEAANVTVYALPSGAVIGPVAWHRPLLSIVSLMSPTLRERLICHVALPGSECPVEWRNEVLRAGVAYLELYKQFVIECRTMDAQGKAGRGVPVRIREGDQPERKLERNAWGDQFHDGGSINEDAQLLIGEYGIRASQSSFITVEILDEPEEDADTREKDAKEKLMCLALDEAGGSRYFKNEHIRALENAASEGEAGWEMFCDILVETLLEDSSGAREMLYDYSRNETLVRTAAARGCTTENVRQQLDRAIIRIHDRTGGLTAIRGILEIRIKSLYLSDRWDRIKGRRPRD